MLSICRSWEGKASGPDSLRFCCTDVINRKDEIFFCKTWDVFELTLCGALDNVTYISERPKIRAFRSVLKRSTREYAGSTKESETPAVNRPF